MCVISNARAIKISNELYILIIDNSINISSFLRETDIFFIFKNSLLNDSVLFSTRMGYNRSYTNLDIEKDIIKRIIEAFSWYRNFARNSLDISIIGRLFNGLNKDDFYCSTSDILNEVIKRDFKNDE